MSWQILETTGNTLQIKYEKNKLQSYEQKESSSKIFKLIENGKRAVVTGEFETSDEELMSSAREYIPYGYDVDYDFPEKLDLKDKSTLSSEYFSLLKEKHIQEIGDEIVQKISSKYPQMAVDLKIVKAHHKIHIRNSYDVDGTFEKDTFIIDLLFTSCSENDIFFWGENFSTLPQNVFEIWNWLQQTMDKLDQLQTFSDIKAGSYPFLFPPEVVSSCLLPVLDAGFGARTLENKSSPLLSKVDTRVLSKDVNIVEEAKYIPFDLDGIASVPKTYFENGTLKTLPVLLSSSNKLKLAPNGANYGSSYYTDLSFRAGSHNLDDMIATIQEGIYLLMSGDMTQGQIINGDLSGTIMVALHIKNGKIVGRIKGKTLSCNFYKMLNEDLLALSKETKTFGSQSFVQCPYVLSKNISVV
ncbi:MAG: hypothetical protein KC646_05195 [Candidatus Cloacimonetes bacterium]|nr:hypothetical protein [Candidatus Cloacimonadota bacterium]